MSAAPNELLRKLVHIAFGFAALLLRWLTPAQAAALAIAAYLHNRFLLPLYLGRRIARGPAGTDRGILYYPIAVLALIVLFRNDLALAAGVWAILAFGDGMATVVGSLVRGPILPWHRSKTWSGLAAFVGFGGTAAWLIGSFVGPASSTLLPWVAIAFATALACGIAESLELGLDDNLVVPLVGGLVMFSLTRIATLPALEISGAGAAWLVANAMLALAGYLARSVTVSGAVGGFALGAILIVFAGWELYVVLLAFFIIGSACTKAGYARKKAAGLAQEEGGRRGFLHAWSNVGVATIIAVLIAFEAGALPMLWIAAIASLATAAADTTASEVGQLAGRRAFLPLTLKRVSPGTEGAVSIEGTLAGALAGIVVAGLGVGLASRQIPIDIVKGTAIVSAAAILGSLLESLAGSWNRTQPEPVPNGALNFFNTLAGALIAAALWSWFQPL
ncbi:MAG: DUF92 domain-containing protein [Thermoanaerobaculia bacterium]